jgi:general secretion pathway protein E/type IV pilus assembly protein PilB
VKGIISAIVREGLLDEQGIARLKDLVARGRPLDDALREADGVPEDVLLRFLAKEMLVPYLELENVQPPRELLARFPARLLLERRLLPVADEGDVIVVATSRLFDTSALDELRMAGGVDVRPVLAPGPEIEQCLRRNLGTGADTLQSLATEAGDAIKVLDEDQNDDLDLTAAAQDASIIRFVNQVLTEALDVRATDVHVEPFENRLRVRYRVDGVLTEANIPPDVRRFQAAIVSRL